MGRSAAPEGASPPFPPPRPHPMAAFWPWTRRAARRARRQACPPFRAGAFNVGHDQGTDTATATLDSARRRVRRSRVARRWWPRRWPPRGQRAEGRWRRQRRAPRSPRGGAGGPSQAARGQPAGAGQAAAARWRRCTGGPPRGMREARRCPPGPPYGHTPPPYPPATSSRCPHSHCPKTKPPRNRTGHSPHTQRQRTMTMSMSQSQPKKTTK